jgi:hypothetical protein
LSGAAGAIEPIGNIDSTPKNELKLVHNIIGGWPILQNACIPLRGAIFSDPEPSWPNSRYKVIKTRSNDFPFHF